jgi:FMN phosphatase YigB (HAD superfamily)
VFDAADKRIIALKPDPSGLFVIAELFKTDTNDIVFIGDREDTDGEAAREANIQYIITDRDEILANDYFQKLAEQIESGK